MVGMTLNLVINAGTRVCANLPRGSSAIIGNSLSVTRYAGNYYAILILLKAFRRVLNDVQECNCSIEERLITLWCKWYSRLFTAFHCRKEGQ